MWIFCIKLNIAQIAQSVEQRIENPRVGGSIPPLGTIDSKPRNCEVFLFLAPPNHDFTSRRREIYFA